jgi:photosystem II stability/assembly factor-like uncharacterized protein
MAPSNHTVLYSAAPSGVFRSSDRGDSWSKITGSLRDVRYLAVDPLNENIVYGREGVVDAWGSGTSTPLNRSENGGQSWHRLSLPDLISPTAVAVDPRDSRVVYVSSHCRLEGDVSEAAGVYKSVDGGNSWAHILTNRTGVDPCASSMALDPASPDTVYVATKFNTTTSARSDDGGATWRPVSDVAGSPIITSPFDPATRYGLECCSRFVVTHDAGQHWTQISPAILGDGAIPAWQDGSARLNGSLAIDPNTGRLFLGTNTGAYRSGDGGQNWLRLPGEGRSPTSGIVFDEVAQRITLATSSGLYQSAAPWEEWRELPVGQSNVYISTVAQDPRSESLYAGGFDLYRSDDRAVSWLKIYPAVPEIDHVRPLITSISVDGGSAIYVTAQNRFAYQSFVLRKGSAAWTTLDPPGFGTDIRRIVADPHRADTLYAVNFKSVARSSDGGSSWKTIVFGSVSGFVISPNDSDTLYVTDSRGSIMISHDAGESFTQRTFDALFPLEVVVSPADPNVLTVLLTERMHVGVKAIARSTDGGGTWAISAPSQELHFASNVALVADPRNASVLVLQQSATSILRSPDGGATWEAIDGPPDLSIQSLLIDRSGTVHAATGRGVWDLSMSAPPRRRVSGR